METDEEKVRESLSRQLRAWELLEGEFRTRLANDPDSQKLLQTLEDDETRRAMLAELAKADPSNPYLRSFNQRLDTAAYETMSRELAQAWDVLEADDDLADAVKVARQGADAVVLGEDLVVIANLVQNIALIAMPVALVLAARIKRIGGAEFYKGVPRHLVDVVNGLKDIVRPGQPIAPAPPQE